MIREFRSEDTPSIVRLFHDTVHKVNVRDYSIEQVNAWAPERADIEPWLERLGGGITLVAEENHAIVGFARLEQRARTFGLKKLFTESKQYGKTILSQQRVHSCETTSSSCSRNRNGKLYHGKRNSGNIMA
jgi:hypothetical protein